MMNMDELIADDAIEEEDQDEEILLEKPFNPADINITTKQLTIDLLVKRLKANPPEIDLTPGFQREKDLWNEKQQSQLIESLLIHFPLPAFYFDGTDDDNWLVIDGLQRLCAFSNFMVSKTLRLTGLEFLGDKLLGKGFDDLDRNLQRLIEETQITTYIIRAGTPEEVTFHIFKRLNTNGLVLNAQEIRHALNQGIPAQFVKELAGSSSFKTILPGIRSDRMEDCEFITRFIAFYISPVKEYKPDYDTYLNEKMKAIRLLSDQERCEIKHKFTASMELCKTIFGKYAFRKIFERNGRQRPINKALFEVWSVGLSRLTDNERDKIFKYKDLLLDKFIQLMNDDKIFANYISSGHKESVEYRHTKVTNLIQEVLAL